MTPDLLTPEQARSACIAVAHLLDGKPHLLGCNRGKHEQHVAGLRLAARLLVERDREIAELRRVAEAGEAR